MIKKDKSKQWKNFLNKFGSDEQFCADSTYTEFQNLKKG